MTKASPRRRLRLKYAAHWRVDYDYVSVLSDEDKDWLIRFNEEYYNGHPSKTAPVHPPEMRSVLFQENNARFRDLVTVNLDAYSKQQQSREKFSQKRRESMYSSEDYVKERNEFSEDDLIEFIDRKLAS